MSEPTEVDFVFLDSASRPYRVKTWAGPVWLFYWHGSQMWVSLRPATADDIVTWASKGRVLEPWEAQLYHEIHAKHS